MNYIKVSADPLGFVNCVQRFPTQRECILAASIHIREVCLVQDDNLRAETSFENNTKGEQVKQPSAHMIKSSKVGGGKRDP